MKIRRTPARLRAAAALLALLLPAAHAQDAPLPGASAAPAAAEASAPQPPASAPQPAASQTEEAQQPAPAPRFGFDGFLLGGFIGGQWVAAAALQDEERWRPWRLQGGEACRIHHFGGAQDEVCTIAPAEQQPHAAGGAPAMPVQTPARTLGAGDALLAITGATAPVQPRAAQLLPTGNATYKKLVARYLAEHGLRGARPDITQLVSVDLDGDGADEMLIAAQNIVDASAGVQAEIFSFAPDAPLVRLRDARSAAAVPASARAGLYSVVLLRRQGAGGKVHTLPLASHIAARGNPAQPRVHRIAAIADLNGDGVMEIITAEARHGALRYRVHEIEGLEARRVLETRANAR